LHLSTARNSPLFPMQSSLSSLLPVDPIGKEALCLYFPF
jgi:hypothetical protein